MAMAGSLCFLRSRAHSGTANAVVDLISRLPLLTCEISSWRAPLHSRKSFPLYTIATAVFGVPKCLPRLGTGTTGYFGVGRDGHGAMGLFFSFAGAFKHLRTHG